MRRGKGGRNGLLPNSLRIISSCLKTVSSNAGSVASTVRSAGASVAASISVPAEDEKDQVLRVCFDKLELGPSSFRHVLLLGYYNGFQVLDVEDASNVHELVSKRDGPVTFLQMQPIPVKSEGVEGFRASHPMLLVVAGDETNGSGMVQGGRLSALIRDSSTEPQPENCISTPTVVRFFSLRSHSYVHVLRFRSAVYIVRCSPRIVAVALAAQIYCFDALTLENKFSVLTYPMQGAVGVNVGYGSMAVGPRWLAYASNNPLVSNTGRLSPQNLTPSPGVSPSTSPSSGSLVARYAMESSKHLAAGIINLGDMGYKTLSKYCQDILPDGSSSPVSSNSSRKSGRLLPSAHPSEFDNAGMVVVKDFVSKDVISQFRAHTSPISALCFDPSGTLLVTASVHGNNINIFRIMPTCIPNGSRSTHYDWTSSHVHLYKLYRGITTAVIQDICFSHYSQWVAIVSSRGTCHIFVLSPFGGEASLQAQSGHRDGPILLPNLPLPWWSTSSCMMDQQFLPPSPIILSVVSRIKNGSSGWLNTVSNVAASAAGKTSVPSGAVAAVFHSSVCHNIQPVHSKANSLEHLLVFSPSGHVIQHELRPSSVAEPFDGNSKTRPGPLSQIQEEELWVNAEPVQWWDVCRRLNWPEREGCTSSISFVGQETTEVVMGTSNYEDNETKYLTSSSSSMAGKDPIKTHERPHWYLFNAEVRGSSGCIPIWQKSKIHFHVMISMRTSERLTNDCAGGEIEIEKFHVSEVEIRQKDLLPVFEHFHSVQSEWNDRCFARGRCLQKNSSENYHAGDKFMEATINRHSMPMLEECSDVGSTTTTGNFLGHEDISTAKPCDAANLQSIEEPHPHGFIQSSILVGSHAGKIQDESIGSSMSTLFKTNSSVRIKNSDQDCEFSLSKCSTKGDSLMDGCVINGVSPLGSFSSYVGRPAVKEVHSSNNVMDNVSNASNSNNEMATPTDSHIALEFEEYFREGYCKISELDDCCELAEAVTDADSSSSHCEREKPEEDVEKDMLGGVFAFSEEG